MTFLTRGRGRWRMGRPEVRFSLAPFLPEGPFKRPGPKGPRNGKRFQNLKRPIQGLGLTIALTLSLGFGSCATAPLLEPLASGEMRLLRLEPPTGEVLANIQYVYTVLFESDGKPRVTRVCFYWSNDGPYCVRPKKVEYGSPGTIEVELRARPPGASSFGTYDLETYVEYIREGKSTRTNIVSNHITVFLK